MFDACLPACVLAVNVWCVERLLSRENPLCCISINSHPFFFFLYSIHSLYRNLSKISISSPFAIQLLCLESCHAIFYTHTHICIFVYFSSAYQVSLSICNQKHSVVVVVVAVAIIFSSANCSKEKKNLYVPITL